MFSTRLSIPQTTIFLSNNRERIIILKFLRRPQVERLTGLSLSTIYAMVADGSFPKQVKIGRRAVAWREADIDDWMLSRVKSG